MFIEVSDAKGKELVASGEAKEFNPRTHANGVPEAAKSAERFRDVQAAVRNAVQYPAGADRFAHGFVKIRLNHDGSVHQVNAEVAVQRILQNIATLVTE